MKKNSSKKIRISIQPIVLECDDPYCIPEVVASLKGQGEDLLDNDHYPIADGDSKALICGNRLVAYALIKRRIAKKINKKVLFPKYFD